MNKPDDQPQITPNNKNISDSQHYKLPNCARCGQISNPKHSCVCNARYYCNLNCKANDFKNHYAKCPFNGLDSPNIIRSDESKYGQVGLENKLNSCYINTTIQCLSCYWEFTNYFLTDKYLQHLNKENPIGSKGLIAQSFSNIIKQLIYGKKNLYFPLNFLLIFSVSQGIFPLGQQHDSQEFLMYLLDTLHEDLNKVKKKPFIENKNTINGFIEDNIISKTEWNNFLRRNQSLIVDLFYGQFKSEILCPDVNICGFISKKFDVFTCLSLPITKHENYYYVKCYFMFYGTNNPWFYISIPFIHINNSIMVLRKKISKLINIHPMSFFVLMYHHSKKIYQYQSIKEKIIISCEQDITLDNDVSYYIIQINPDLFKDKTIKNEYEITGEKNKDTIEKNYQELFKEELEDPKEDINNNNRLKSNNFKIGQNGTFYNYSFYYPNLYNINLSTKGINNKSFGKVCVDNYYGFDPNSYIHIPVYIKNPKNFREKENSLHFILTFDLNASTVDVHKTLFKYLLPTIKRTIINIHINSNESIDLAQIDDYFPNLTEISSSKKMNSQIRDNIMNKYLYKVYINEEMNILLPYDNSKSLGEVVKAFNKNQDSTQTDYENDNSFYFLSFEQRELIQNRNNNFALYVFSDKNLDLFRFENLEKNQKSVKPKKNTKLYLEDLIFNFTKWEVLDETNAVICEKCKKKQKAQKRIQIFKCPYYLIIQLKRFNNFRKDCSFVQFPLYNLDMSKFSCSYDESNLPMLYDLVSVINHNGGIDSGHFFAFCKNAITKEWFKFDDDNFKKINEEKDIIENTAYVLFYRRKGLEKYFDMNEQYNKPFENIPEQKPRKTFTHSSTNDGT
jgi:ubiquitin carboxyl-terminal hydrolase 4/11/15